MKNLDYEYEVEDVTKDTVWLYFLGDTHLESKGCAENDFERKVEEIAHTKNALVALMGDYTDSIGYTDKRFDPRQLSLLLRENPDDLFVRGMEHWLSITEPIHKQCIGALTGNHDDKVRLGYHFNMVRKIAEQIGCSELPFVSQLRLRIFDGKGRSYMVKGVLSHIEKNSEDEEGKLRIAKKLAGNYSNIDFFAQAHMHGYATQPYILMDTAGRFRAGANPRTIERQVWVFLTGGYLKTYAEGTSGYGERRGYRPCRLGTPRLGMRMSRKKYDQVELVGEA